MTWLCTCFCKQNKHRLPTNHTDQNHPPPGTQETTPLLFRTNNSINQLFNSISTNTCDIEFYNGSDLVLRGNNTFQLNPSSLNTISSNLISIQAPHKKDGVSGFLSLNFQEDKKTYWIRGQLTNHKTQSQNQPPTYDLNFAAQEPVKSTVNKTTTYVFPFLGENQVHRNSTLIPNVRADRFSIIVEEWLPIDF